MMRLNEWQGPIDDLVRHIIGWPWRVVNGRQSSKFIKELVHLFQLLLRLPSGIWAVCRNATAKIPFPCHWGRQFPPTNVEMATRPNLGEFSLLSFRQNKLCVHRYSLRYDSFVFAGLCKTGHHCLYLSTFQSFCVLGSQCNSVHIPVGLGQQILCLHDAFLRLKCSGVTGW